MEGTQTRQSGWRHFWGKVTGQVVEDDYIDEEEEMEHSVPAAKGREVSLKAVAMPRYHVTIRRNVISFQDAADAADGLKRGEQQILNLFACQPDLREKIKDFLFGVTYNAEGDMQEVGDHVFMFVPACANVEIANPAGRKQTSRFN